MCLLSHGSLQDTVLQVIQQHCLTQRLPYAPDMLINGRPGFSGEEAEDLIYAAAEKIGLTREEVEHSFPFGTYFEPETSLSLWPVLLAGRLFRQSPTYQLLTAVAFAELLVSFKQERSTNPTS